MGKKSPLLYELRAAALEGRHDFPAAIRDFGKALEIRPDDGRLLVGRGWAYLVYDSPKLAMADFESAIKLDPVNADAYNGRGTAHVKLGNLTAAVGDAVEARRLGRGIPRVTYNAARIYALAASVAAAAAGEKGRLARPLVSKYQDIALQLVRETFEGQRPRNAGVLARNGPVRPGIEGDPAAAQVRGIDRASKNSGP